MGRNICFTDRFRGNELASSNRWLVISVEPLIDMARTAVNVSGSMVAGIVTSARIKDLDRDVINDDSKVIDVNA